MKTHTIASLWILSFTLPALADTFTMKDGSTVEGAVLRENDTSYVVEVNVTKSIKDERILAKADVVKVEREKLDLTAFEEIAKFVPTPDMLTTDDYGQRIRAVEKFLANHRSSPKAREARDMLAKLKAEANEVLAGGVKMNGKIIPPSEYRANAYDIDAKIQEAKIRALVKDNRYLMALRVFSDFSRDFRNTTAHAAVLPLITQVINSYVAEINQSLSTYDARLKEREVGLQRMSSADRSTTEGAIHEEMAALEARLKAEKEAKITWVTTHPFLKATLEETVTFAKQEITRISAAASAPTVDGGKAYREALSVIQNKGDAASVATAIGAAKAALVPAKYLTILETAATASGALK